MYYRYHKIFFSTFFFLSSLLFFSQEIDVQKKLNLIDSVRDIDPELALKTSDELVLYALKTKNDELFVNAQIVAVQIIKNQGNINEALNRVKEMVTAAKKTNNRSIKAMSLMLLATFYNELHLVTDAENAFNEVLSIYKDEESDEANKFKGNAYISKMHIIINKNNDGLYKSSSEEQSKMLSFARKALSYYKKISESNKSYNFHYIKGLGNLAQAHTEANNTDSVIYYSNLLVDFAKKNNNLNSYLLGYHSLGNAYASKNDLETALYYRFKTLAILDSTKNNDDKLVVYKEIADNYKKLNDSIKSQEYELKYFTLKHSLDSIKNHARIDAHEQIVGEIKEEQDQYEFISMIVLGILLSLMIIGVIFFKRNRKKSKQKQEEISKKLESVQEDKTADQVKELVALAKKNDLAFLPTFNKVFPHFRDTLLKRHPKLTTNDIKFCALIKLNFTSKEIAQYTFVSIKTVESKRYRLRKKLELDSAIDLNKWIKNI